MTKVNLGCGWRNFGSEWIHVDLGDYEHLDYKCDISKGLPFENESIDLIYSSHAIAYLDEDELIKSLKEWHRKLKPGGTLRLATPDFNAISKLYSENRVDLCDIIGPLYGKMKMGNKTIYHKKTYDLKTLEEILREVGFVDVCLYDWNKYKDHVENDDHSQAYLCPKGDKDNGVLISLNVECKK